MKKEYDFSKGERGKFYRPDAELHLPIYLEPEMMEALRKLSKKKGVDVSTIVNEWIKKDISIVETVTKQHITRHFINIKYIKRIFPQQSYSIFEE